MRAPRRSCGAGAHERPGRGEHDQNDERGPQQQQQEMPELETARALALGFAQVAHGREHRLGRAAPLEQMQQRRDRRGGEPEQQQRMQEDHASKRNARPNGMSVCTW